MTDLFGESIQRLDLAEQCVERMRSAGVRAAELKGAYDVAVHDATLRERAKGTAATNIRDIVKGMRDVSGIDVERRCAEEERDAYEHLVNVHKLRARILSEQLNREWGLAGRGDIQ